MLALVLTSTSVDAAAWTEPITIRTYNYARVDTELLASARVAAGQPLERAGISLQWVECRVPQGVTGAPCTEPLRERDLMLRLTEQNSEIPVRMGRRVVSLGSSMLDREHRSGVLMTIDLLPVRTIAQQTAASLFTLLGRAIAHEIGHLLLGTSEHPRTGLMRARWSHDELRGARPASWEFSAREAADMRRGLASKGRSAN